jgi:hypothetical protein
MAFEGKIIIKLISPPHWIVSALRLPLSPTTNNPSKLSLEGFCTIWFVNQQRVRLWNI